MAYKNNLQSREKTKDDLRREKIKNKRFDRSIRRERFTYTSNILSIFALILLIGSLISILNGTSTPTFESFLQFLSDCPQFDIVTLLIIPEIPIADWGIFQVIGVVLNALIAVLNALVFIAKCIVQSLLIILWFMRWLFL